MLLMEDEISHVVSGDDDLGKDKEQSGLSKPSGLVYRFEGAQI